MQLIILGMHRSGTSVLTRLINLMGVYFGPEGISTGANQENPKGFWERRDVRELNDLVLQGSGCDWDRVSKFDLDAVPAPILQEFNKRASRLVLEMDAHRPWMLKEPRLCLLLPLWRRWIELPIGIHVYRNPVEVASSLNKRNGIPMEAGLALWDRYVRSALEASSDMPRIVVSHRQLVQQPAVALPQLLRDLEGLGVPGLRMPSEREFEAFVQDDLYREREDREDLLAYRKAPQLHLFRTLESGGLPPGKAPINKASSAALAKYEAGLPPLSVPGSGAPAETAESLRGKLALRDQEIKFVRELAGKHEASAEQHAQRVADLAQEVSLAQVAAAKLEGELRLRDERAAGLEREATAAREAATQLEARFLQHVAEVGNAAGFARETATWLEAELRQRDERLAAQELHAHSLQQANERLDIQLRESREAFREGEENFKRQLAELRRCTAAEADLTERLARRDQDLVESKRQIAELTGHIKDSDNHVGQLERAARQVDEAKQALEQQHADLKLRLQERERDCQVKEQEVRALETACRKAERNVDLRHRELAALTRLLLDREEQLDQSTLANRQLTAAHQRSVDEAEALRGVIDRIRRSRSWRLTAPLRAVLGRDDGVVQVHASEEAGMLASSELFDGEWYLQHYPEVARSGMAPIEHFLRIGAAERKDPGPGFSTAGYLRNNPDVGGAGVNPLVHYIAHGKAEGRRWK
jgi:hypothetical protein